MLNQQLTANAEEMSGTLVVTAAPGALAELQGLAAELSLRPTMTTDGDINVRLPVPEVLTPPADS